MINLVFMAMGCGENGAYCTMYDQCCSGVCSNAKCISGPVSCLPPGEVCHYGVDCCNGVCRDNVCLGPNGCTPYGMIAKSNCCSGFQNKEPRCIDTTCLKDGLLGMNRAPYCCEIANVSPINTDVTCYRATGSQCTDDEQCEGELCLNGKCAIKQVEDCRQLNENCEGDFHCCAGNCKNGKCGCNPLLGLCYSKNDCCGLLSTCLEQKCVEVRRCADSGGFCFNDLDCCEGRCILESCVAECAEVEKPCVNNSQCCSANCNQGVCDYVDLGGSCEVSISCRKGFCRDGKCSLARVNDKCETSADCASNNCHISSSGSGIGFCECASLLGACQEKNDCCGLLATCVGGSCVEVKQPKQCLPIYEKCIFSQDCCSGDCHYYSTGKTECKCSPLLGQCQSQSDCCGLAAVCVEQKCVELKAKEIIGANFTKEGFNFDPVCMRKITHMGLVNCQHAEMRVFGEYQDWSRKNFLGTCIPYNEVCEHDLDCCPTTKGGVPYKSNKYKYGCREGSDNLKRCVKYL